MRKKINSQPKPPPTLRERAEAAARASRTDIARMPAGELQRLVHELQVHQIELEMQNEELRRAQSELGQPRDRFNDLYDFAPVGFLTLDHDATVLEANLTAASMLGVEREKLIGRKFTRFVARAAQDTLHLHRRAVLDGDGKQACDLLLRRADGTTLFARMETTCVRNAGSLSAIIDITRREETEADLARVNATLEEQVAERTQSLRESEERLNFALETNHTGAWTLNLADHTTFRSIEHDRIFDYADLLPVWTYEMFLEHVMPEDRATVDRKFRQATERHSDWNFECRIRRADGEIRWIVAAGRHRHDAAGAPRHMAGIVQDITERKQAEAALRESEERFRQVTEAIDQVFWMSDVPKNRLLYVSPGYERIWGRTCQSLLDSPRTWLSAIHPADRPRVLDAALKKQITGEYDEEYRITRPDGTKRWIRDRAFPIRDAAGKVHRIAGVADDITERKRAGEALQAREAQLHSFVQQAPVAIAMFDRNMKYLAVSKRWISDYEGDRDDLVGISHYDAHPDLPERWKEVHRKGLGGEHQSSDEDLWLQADGRRLWLRWSVNPWLDAHGNIGGIMILSENITARKLTEEALRESETRYRQLIHGLPAAFFTCDATGRITLYNAAAATLWGREPNLDHDRWSGAQRLFTPDGRPIPRGRSPIALAVLQDEPIRDAEMIVERPDGSRSHVLAFPDPIHDSTGAVIGAMNMLVDITESRRAAAALQESEARLRAILNTVVDAIITIDQRGSITGVNPATERMFGYSAGEMVGKNVSLLMPSPSRQEHDGYLANDLRPGQARIIGIGREVQGQRKDGSVFPIDLAVSEVKDMQLFTGVIRDITDRKRLEAEVLAIGEEERLRVAADLHDGICQELVGIQYLGSLLRRDLEETRHALAAQAGRIEKAIIGTADHTRQVARGLNPVVADGSGLTHALRLLAGATTATHRIRCAFQSPAPVSIENPTVANQLYRVAQEAIHNAIRHSRATRITVRLSETASDLCLAVTDNGRGLPADVSGAPGMGLRVMKYRAGLIGGHLLVQPRKRGGTEVVCRIPKSSTNP